MEDANKHALTQMALTSAHVQLVTVLTQTNKLVMISTSVQLVTHALEIVPTPLDRFSVYVLVTRRMITPPTGASLRTTVPVIHASICV